jgi:hypothetical protein
MKTRSFPSLRSLVIALALTFTFQAAAQSVAIPDPELQISIRQALGKPNGDITVQDMESLRELDASIQTRGFELGVYRQIKSLEGLQAATHLTTLKLAGSRVRVYIAPGIALTNFAPLADLKKLTPTPELLRFCAPPICGTGTWQAS